MPASPFGGSPRPSGDSPELSTEPSARAQRGRALIWVSVILLCALGVLLAVLDAAGESGSHAADGSFGGHVPVPQAVPALVVPARDVRPAPAAELPTDFARGAQEAAQVVRAAIASAARRREADLLIEGMLATLRAEREARAQARARRHGARRTQAHR